MLPRIHKMIRLPFVSLLTTSLLLGVAGCSGSARVKGKVSYQGREVVYGSVIFLSADRTARSGVIEPDGSYSVDGVHPGVVKIGVVSRDPSKGRSHVAEKTKERTSTLSKSWFPLPRSYENPDNSGLACTLGSGRASFDIDLK